MVPKRDSVKKLLSLGFFQQTVFPGPITCTDSGAIFDSFLEVFWIFLKNEHGKVKGTPNQALCVGQVSIDLI